MTHAHSRSDRGSGTSGGSEAVSWLWKNWLSFGKTTVIAGHGGSLMERVAQHLAARISTGEEMPDGRRATPRDVVWIQDRDVGWSANDLACEGADLTRVQLKDTIHLACDTQSLSEMLNELADDLQSRRQRPGLVVVCPVESLQATGKHWLRGSIGEVVEWLDEFAANTGSAVLGIHYTNKRVPRAVHTNRVKASEVLRKGDRWVDRVDEVWLCADDYFRCGRTAGMMRKVKTTHAPPNGIARYRIDHEWLSNGGVGKSRLVLEAEDDIANTSGVFATHYASCYGPRGQAREISWEEDRRRRRILREVQSGTRVKNDIAEVLYREDAGRKVKIYRSIAALVEAGDIRETRARGPAPAARRGGRSVKLLDLPSSAQPSATA